MSEVLLTPLMRIGALADKAGRTQRTLHFYEELGLLTPVGRTKGGFRLYDQDSLLRIHWIGRLQELDFSLPEIRDFLEALRSAQSAPAMMRSLEGFYRGKREETRAQLLRLQSLDTELADAVDYLAGCTTCAPSTEKSACPTCEEGEHSHTEAPALVAALRETTPHADHPEN
ncbi:MAG: MerR family transcriptional regulator [Myxococcales bacterium]|nr:MerR family transcriptional regulator [Myxococcales bacterium]